MKIKKIVNKLIMSLFNKIFDVLLLFRMQLLGYKNRI